MRRLLEGEPGAERGEHVVHQAAAVVEVAQQLRIHGGDAAEGAPLAGLEVHMSRKGS